jgi:signal transduction histidine kinase
MRSGLAPKIYLIGLVQLLVVAFGMALIERARPPRTLLDSESRFVAETIGRASDSGDELQHEVERVSNTLGWSVIVRDADGRVMAQAERTFPPDARVGRRAMAFKLASGAPATVEYGFARRPPPNAVMQISLVLLVVGVASMLTARALTRPLAKLSDTARAFGAGELDARVNMTRRDEIGEVARAFDEMADRVARLLLAERELLANVSHELRTPLARIRVALDLANEAEPQHSLESLKEIAEDLAELERIVDDVLAAARDAFEEGPRGAPGLTVRREPLDTRALIERAIVKFRAAHPARSLSVAFEDDLPIILGDPILVRRVVDNLLDNAHKYTDDESKRIAIEARHDGSDVLISIEDQGVGIAPSDVERLCEPFFRADRSRARATGGLGLGLALARRVVDAHGGTLEFESTVGVGTTARIRLPAVMPD